MNMTGLLPFIAVKEKAKTLFSGIVHSKYFAALMHVPVVGGFAAILCMPYFVNKTASLEETVKTGVAAQLVVPGIFTVGSALRYLVWLMEWDVASQVLGYGLGLYLLIGYGLMMYNAYRTALGKTPQYKGFSSLLNRVARLLFS